MAPALRIPARLDMTEFRQNVAEARGLVQQSTDFMIRQLEKTAAKSAIFDLPRLIQNNDTARAITQKTIQAIASDLGKLTAGSVNAAVPNVLNSITQSVQLSSQVIMTVGIPAARGLAESWLPIIARAAAVYAAFKVVQDVVQAVAHEIELMVDVANKARDRGLSPETFQATIAAARGAVNVIRTLEDAMASFFQATKRRMDENVSPDALDSEKEKWSELGRVIREVRFEGLASQGPQTFLNAGADVNRQWLGVLQTIRELWKSGQQLEALRIADMINPSFGDQLRTGRINIEQIASTVERMLARGVQDGWIFSDAMVQRAKDINDKLQEAQYHLDKEMKPTMEGLADTMLTIKSLWADVVELTAQAVALIGKIDLQDVADLLRGPGGLANIAIRRGARAFGGGANAPTRIDIEVPTAPTTTSPRRRPTNIPQPPEKDTPDNRDRFDSAADSIEKRTAALDAETANINLNTQARERAKIVAELETVAKQANADAGKGENVITEEQRQRIDEVAEAYGRAALAIEQARSPLATFARESQNVGKALNQFAASSLGTVTDGLADMVTGTKSVGDAFRSMANSIISDLARIAIRQTITGPLASALFGGGGGLGGLFSGIFGGARAAGGPVEAGKAYLVNENTPRSEIFVPDQDGMIYPNAQAPSVVPAAVSGRASAGAPNYYVSITSSPVFQAGMTPTDIAAIEARLQQSNQELRQQVQTDLRTNIRNDADYLAH